MIDIEGIKARLDIAENGIKCAEQAIENAKACFDKAKEMLDANDSAPPRNWPERIEAGMCFGREDVRYVLFGKRLANIESGVIWSTSGDPFGGDQSEFDYLGKMDLTIRTDAHEPTGAELVGKMCEFSDRLTGPWSPGECAAFGQNSSYPYRKAGGAEWKLARLAK